MDRQEPGALVETPWFIIGCGYVGTRLAHRLLERKVPLCVTRRSEEGCAKLRKTLPLAEVKRFEVQEASKLAIPAKAVVVVCSPPGPRSPGDERAFAISLPTSVRLMYISTTGVYAPGHGKEVDDTHPTTPASERGEARLSVEKAMGGVHDNSVFLRVPGIYGPWRGVHRRMQAGNYRLIGAANTLVGRIHVDDLVSALLVLGSSDKLRHREFIIGDDTPTTAREHALGVAERLQLPEPPSVDTSSVSPAVVAMLGADRRILPRRLHALDWRPQYPSWREGLEQALAEEAQSGRAPSEH